MRINMKPKNWDAFQHYKDRCPPWIKLHRGLLNDRSFMCLPIESKALAPMLWLLASESQDGEFDGSIEELSFRLRLSSKEVEKGLKPLIDNGFFIADSAMLASCYQGAIPETERETETKTEKRQIARGTRLPNNWVPDSDLAAWSKAERPDLDLRQVLMEFRDYWSALAGAKAVKLDWDATWRNWVRKQNASKSVAQADVARATVPASVHALDSARRQKDELAQGKPPSLEQLEALAKLRKKT